MYFLCSHHHPVKFVLAIVILSFDVVVSNASMLQVLVFFSYPPPPPKKHSHLILPHIEAMFPPPLPQD
jgi:hypothetical protein